LDPESRMLWHPGDRAERVCRLAPDSLSRRYARGSTGYHKTVNWDPPPPGILRLRTFGGLSLESDEGALNVAALQRRRLAILTLLAVARDRGVSRDKVLAYLWPEGETERARHTLSQLIYALRRDLKADVVIGTAGEMLRLNRDVIRSDVAEFEDALDAGELERAVELYTGPFLDGWFIADAPEYERWAESERGRIAGRAVTAFRRLAEQATARADHDAAVRWWRQLATFEPLDARAAVGLMSALAAAGDRGAALRHARVYETLVQQELDAPPDPAVTALADRLRDAAEAQATVPATRSPTSTADSSPVAVAPTAGSDARPDAYTPDRVEAAGSQPRQRSRKRAALYGLATLLVLLAYGTATRLASRERHTRSDLPNDIAASPAALRNAVAVLPFVNISADPDNEYLSDGMTEELINMLTRVNGLRVTARTSAFALKAKHMDVIEIGRQLKVGTVLEGSVRKSGKRLRVTAQLVDTDNGFEIWSDVYDRDMTDVFQVQEEISRAIAGKLRGEVLGGSRTPVPKPPTVNSDAYDLYLRGRYFWNQRTGISLNKSIDYYRRALELDSGYAYAYAGLSDSYAILGANGWRPLTEALPKAKAAGDRALALDSTLSGVHATRALMQWLEWDWPAADEEFRRSIALDSGYAQVRLWYALYLSGMGRSYEAIREISRAHELDPLSLIVNTEVGRVLELAGRDDQAREAYRRTVEIDSTYWAANYLIALFQIRERQFDSAAAVVARMVRGSKESDVLELRGYAYATQGDTAAAQRTLTELRRTATTRYVSPFSVARIYAALGDWSQAMRWLERGYSEHASEMVTIKVDPVLDALRSDKRFTQLVKRMRLE